MPSISKFSDTSYKVTIGGDDIARAFPENFTDIDTITNNTSSGKVIDGSVVIEFTPDAAEAIRAKVSRELILGMDLGDAVVNNRFLHALFSSPVPCAGMYGGVAPSLSSADDEAISAALNGLPISYEFSVSSLKIGISDRYRLKFIPDARGFDIYLENVDLEDNLLEDHPFAITVPFVISSLDVDNPVVTDGVASKMSFGQVDDARVMFFEKEMSINVGEVLTRSFVLSGISDRGSLIDAYNALFTLPIWRGENGTSVLDSSLRPYTDHLCGVDPSRKAIQYLPLTGLVGSEPLGHVNLIFSGTATVKFLVGEVRYPFNPILGNNKILFDVCKDDEGWTDVGPLAEQYIGGVGVEGVNVIHSWTGRTSTNVKKESLASIGQSKLGG